MYVKYKWHLQDLNKIASVWIVNLSLETRIYLFLKKLSKREFYLTSFV